jgi:AcrR family transcriptional regulator
MSGKIKYSMKKPVSAEAQKTNRRVRRTRNLLGDALVELMHEKAFADIKIQHVLDRAGISRSTFYAHYSDKDDLFVSDVDEFFQGMATMLSRQREVSERVAPAREIFAHLAEARKFYDALVASGKVHDAMEMAQGHFARGIEQRLAESPRAQGISQRERPAISNALAGSLLSLLKWWINHGNPGSPEQMDDTYHRLVWSGVGGSGHGLASKPKRSGPPAP